MNGMNDLEPLSQAQRVAQFGRQMVEPVPLQEDPAGIGALDGGDHERAVDSQRINLHDLRC